VQEKQLGYMDLAQNEKFSIVSPRSKGTIYRKVQCVDKAKQPNDWAWGMLEEATGFVFPPTNSPVTRVAP